MRRRSTPRLAVALFATAAGAIIAIMAGRVDAALLVAPWAVILTLGLSGARSREVEGWISVDSERVVAGDMITVKTRVVGAAGWLGVTVRPQEGFHDSAVDREPFVGGDSVVDSDAAGDGDSAVDGEPLTEDQPVVAGDSAADIASESGTELCCSLTTSAWGTHDVGRVDLEVNEPYGLLRWTGALITPSKVRVHPRPAQLDELLAPWLVRRVAGAHDSPAVGQGVEFAELRQFTVGDSLRDINWRASARSNELWVSQRHPDQSTEVVLLLDTFIESGHEIRTVLGLAVEAAIAMAESHLGATDRVGLIELGGIVRWVSPRTGGLQLQRLVDALLATRLYESAADRNLDIVPYPALPPRSFVIALSPLLDERFVRTLFVLRAAGHDVSVIECPPLLEDLGDGGQQSESFRLATRFWQAERDLTNDRLAARGIAVGRWTIGDPVQQVVAELIRRRRATRSVLRR